MTRKLIGVIVTLLLVGFTVIGFAQKENALTLGGTGTINQLEQWRATSTPFSAITTAVNGKNIYIPRSSATTSALTATTICLVGDSCRTTWPTVSGGSSAVIQTDGVTQNTGAPTLNFTSNSFSLTESPTDTFTLRIATTTLGLLTTNVGEGSNLYSTDTRARAALSDTVTGLTYTAGTGVLSLDSGYVIPSTTRMVNADTAYSWGNHATQGYLTTVATTTVRGMFSNTATGLTYTSGTGATALTAGYVIPTTTRAVNWDTAYSWGNHASAGYLTGNQTITLSGDASGSGATAITVAVTDDSHAHTGSTLSGIDISADTNLSADGTEIVLTGDALSLGNTLTITDITTTRATATNATSTSFFSALGTFTNSVINTLLTAVDATITGVLTIPNGTGPTANDPGELAHDTSDNQLILDDYVIRTKQELFQFSVPSTSPAFAANTVKYLPVKEDGYVVTDIFCSVEGGTSKAITLFGESITCDADGAVDDGTISIATIGAASTTAGGGVTAGATTGVVNWLNVTVSGLYTRE